MTRIDKFIKSFGAFMEIFELEKWTLVKVSPRHNGAHHDFDLTIPVHYNEEEPNYVGEGLIEWDLTRTMQNRPTHEEFETKFTEYFEPHGDPVWNRVYLGDHHVDDDDVYYLKVRLRLTNSSTLPFPNPINNELRFRRLENENEILRTRLNRFSDQTRGLTDYWHNNVLYIEEQYTKLIRRRQRDRSCMIDNNARHVTRIVNKLKSYYRDQAVKEDCPICLEQIETDKLYIPRCCHYLCEPCAQHVIQLNNKCPICRDDMYTTIGEYMPFLSESTDQLENGEVINA